MSNLLIALCVVGILFNSGSCGRSRPVEPVYDDYGMSELVKDVRATSSIEPVR